jgi:hypothetical protein
MSSSGLTDVWTRAAAPDLIAANSPSSSSIATSTMIPALGSSRLIRGMVSKPAGTGKAASTRTMSGAFSTTASSALGPSTVSADDLEIGLGLEAVLDRPPGG